MKIFVDLNRDQSSYGGDIAEAFQNMGWEVTGNAADNFDEGLALVAADHVFIMSSLQDRNIASVESHELCDKWHLYNFLKDKNMPTIPTCLPKSIEEAQDFFHQYGAFIVKPRVGGGCWGPYDFHYKKYTTIEEFISDSSTIDNFWQTQNSTEYKLPVPTRQCILQQYIIPADQEFTEQIRFKCDINDKSEFVYQITERVIKSVTDAIVIDPKLPLKRVVDDYQHIIDRLPNDVTYKDPEIEAIIKKFIENSNLKSCYISFECLILDNVYYINDTTTSPPVIRSAFSKIDGINYQEDSFRFHYGLKTEPPIDFSRYYFMASFPVPGGMTRERLAQIENNNVRKLWQTYTGAPEIWLVIRGNTLEEFLFNKQTVVDYLNSLS